MWRGSPLGNIEQEPVRQIQQGEKPLWHFKRRLPPRVICRVHELLAVVHSRPLTADHHAVTKLSILLLFRRIFVQTFTRTCTTIVGVVIALWWFGNFFADALICIPVQKNWIPDLLGHCGINTCSSSSANRWDRNGRDAPCYADAHVEDIARTQDPEGRACWVVPLRWLVSLDGMFGLKLV